MSQVILPLATSHPSVPATSYTENPNGCAFEVRPIEAADSPSIDEQMATLFERFGVPDTEEDVEAALVAQAALIRAIAGACERTAVHRMASGKVAKFKENIDATTPPGGRLSATWNHFLSKLIDCPTAAHTAAAVRLYLPMVAGYLPAKMRG